MQMRPLRRATLVLLPLLVIAGLIAFLSLDRLLKRTIETQSTNSLRLSTTLNRARLSLFGGKVNLNRLRIASPPSFSAPHLLELGDVDVAVRYGQLRNDPIHVQSLALRQPRLVIEQSNGALNFRAAIDRSPPGDRSASEKPLKLVIDELKMQDAQVVIHPGLPGVRHEIIVLVPAIALKNIGSGRGAQNGAAIKDVAGLVITVLAASAAQSSSLPPELRAVLQLNAGRVAAKLGAEAQKQIAAAVPGALGARLSTVAADPEGLAKDPGKVLQDQAGGILGGKSTPPAAGRPAPQPKR
jgi:AsmA family